MSWFFFALVCLLGWGFADMFYKKSSDDGDKYSHLKIAVWVGLTMGVTSVCLLVFGGEKHSASQLIENGVKYLPASMSYVVSMIIGYVGLRYLELSIVSPLQNASGAFSAVAMLLFLAFSGNVDEIQRLAEPNAENFLIYGGTLCIVVGVIVLAVVEQKLSKQDETPLQDDKYRKGALALLFPLLYCLFDTIGTSADGIILSQSSMNLSEIDVLILYGLTFFLVGLGCWIFILCKTHRVYNPFAKGEIKTKGVASLCEQFGQIFYVFAMAQNPVVASPMIASYCIVSVLLSKWFLKEKLTTKQRICIAIVIVGIVLLGISDGLAEL